MMYDCYDECGEGLDFAEQIVLEAGTLAALEDDHALEDSDDGEDSGQVWCANSLIKWVNYLFFCNSF